MSRARQAEGTYDVICAGGGLTSFLCGALLANRGKRVYVVDDPDRAVSRRYGAGYLFDPDFFGYYGLNETSALGRSVAELGIDPGLFLASESETQVLTPEFRLRFGSDVEDFSRSIKTEIKSHGSEIAEFFALIRRSSDVVPGFVENALTRGQVSSSMTAQWRRFWGPYFKIMQADRPVALSQALAEPIALPCERIGGAILGATSFAAPVSLGCEQGIRGLALSFGRQGHVVGGQEALLGRLGEIVVSRGGVVKRHSRVESLIMESDRVAGVLLSSFEGIVRAPKVVLCSNFKRSYATLPESMQDKATMRSLERVVTSSWRFTISVTVKRDALALGASDFMAYVDFVERAFEEENFLRIQVLPDALRRQMGAGTEDEATLLVTAWVPYRASTLDYRYLRRLGGRMLHALSKIMPFLDESIVAIYPDFRKDETELREVYRFSGPDWLPDNLMSYYLRGDRQAQDFWGPSWTTPHPGLYFGGRSIWPALGPYGEALAARRIFDDVISPTN